MLGATTLRAVYTGGITSSGGVGPKTLLGAVVGDNVINVGPAASSDTFNNSLSTFFESVISVNDQIQQISPGDLSADDPLEVFLLR